MSVMLAVVGVLERDQEMMFVTLLLGFLKLRESWKMMGVMAIL
jgi:hypothetical protein